MFETRGQLREQMKEEGRQEGVDNVLKLLKLPEEERTRIREQALARQASQSNGASVESDFQQGQSQLLGEIRDLLLDMRRDQLREGLVKEVQQEAMARILDDLKRRGIDVPPETAPDDEDAS